MKKRLDALKRKEKRLIVGIETGSAPEKMAAALVEISGQGDETMIALLGFTTRPVSRELRAAFGALGRDERFDSEELAGINFLLLHNLTNLYDKTLQAADVAGDEIDVVGLKCLEVGEHVFPADPGVFSEMTNRIVASRFSIGTNDGSGKLLAVEESLLQGIVTQMMDRFSLGEEVREAVTVALLANEAIFCAGVPSSGSAAKKGARKTGVRKSLGAAGPDGEAYLCGEFFFPR